MRGQSEGWGRQDDHGGQSGRWGWRRRAVGPCWSTSIRSATPPPVWACQPTDATALVAAPAAEPVARGNGYAEPGTCCRAAAAFRTCEVLAGRHDEASTLEQHLAHGMDAYEYGPDRLPPSLGQLTHTALASFHRSADADPVRVLRHGGPDADDRGHPPR